MFLFNVGFLEIRFVDLLDITLVAVLLYNVYKLIRGSVALRVSLGFLLVYLVYLVVKATEMEMLTSILGQFMSVGVLGALIIFQNEIRKFLLLVGKSTNLKDLTIANFFNFGKTNSKDNYDITSIIEALKSLGATNTGALIVVSKDDELKFFAETGDILDAKVSKRLLMSIFFKNSPLHDGAVIIHKGRVVAARCILPVSENQNIPATMGLRHRAAIGMSEERDDVVVLIVSEETGQLSYVANGEIFHNLSPIEIRTKLNEYLANKPEPEKVEKSEKEDKEKSDNDKPSQKDLQKDKMQKA
ncbi:diadenylate cyclase CdaA [Chondrinema litorale]|uniref:diadenylate cyclase CdaA n=1 Tax=Chondrinema litorale TaxID=2994555 RepID=UPI0025428FB1|nr:diadenylate cyclase CdaA [Chondrinema litorale]UZR95854.1 diadenylate cyclase CdaA [Chondrinema litorale]